MHDACKDWATRNSTKKKDSNDNMLAFSLVDVFINRHIKHYFQLLNL